MAGSGGASRQKKFTTLTAVSRPWPMNDTVFREGNQYVFRRGKTVSPGRAEALVGTRGRQAMERVAPTSPARQATWGNKTAGASGWAPSGHEKATRRELGPGKARKKGPRK